MARTRGDGFRRRPKDRKAQIATASAEAFSALGYHGVSMEAIANRVGISAAALYRHYSSKYELFRDAVLSLGQQLVDCTAFADDAADDDPAETLRRLVAALTDTALANRESGGLYGWEARYLRGDDQATLNSQLRSVHHWIQSPLMVIRPELTSRQRSTLSTSVLSVVGSIVDHRAKLPAVQVRALLGELAAAALSADLLEAAGDSVEADRPHGVAVSESSKYEALLNESMLLFNQKGYRDTSMEDIAAAVGMPASGMYRYFSGKSDILAAAFRRAADRLSAELSSILNTVADPEDALTTVIDAYVLRSFNHPELDYVYYTERLNMSPADQHPAEPAAVRGRVLGGSGGVGPSGVDARAGALRRSRSDVAGDRPGQVDALPQLRAISRHRRPVAGPDATGSLSVADHVDGQIGQVADRSDHGQRPGLASAEPQAERGLEATVGVDVLTDVSRKRRLGDRFEHLRAGEMRQPDAGDRQAGVARDPRALLRA